MSRVARTDGLSPAICGGRERCWPAVHRPGGHRMVERAPDRLHLGRRPCRLKARPAASTDHQPLLLDGGGLGGARELRLPWERSRGWIDPRGLGRLPDARSSPSNRCGALAPGGSVQRVPLPPLVARSRLETPQASCTPRRGSPAAGIGPRATTSRAPPTRRDAGARHRWSSSPRGRGARASLAARPRTGAGRSTG